MKNKIEQIKYIVFMLETNVPRRLSDGQKIDVHEGAIFNSLKEAEEYANDAVKHHLCNRFVIGLFVIDDDVIRYPQERIDISLVETYGFKKDVKHIGQLDLFNQNKK